MKHLSLGLAALFLSMAVVGCAMFSTANPQQAVYSAKSTYTVALSAAVAYESLPRCEAPAAPLVCSKLAVVEVLRKADTAADAALDAAEATVRTPGFGDDVYGSAATAAVQAVTAFVRITAAL